MTNAINTTEANAINRFSWKRVKMLFDFYLPITKYQMIAYASISFSYPIIYVIQQLVVPNVDLSSFWRYIILSMILWAPSIFNIRNFRKIATTLPVSNNEKTLFYFIYIYLIIPATILIPPILGIVSTDIFTDASNIFTQIYYNNSSYDTPVNFVQYIHIFTVILLFISIPFMLEFRTKRYKTLKYIAIFVCYISVFVPISFFLNLIYNGLDLHFLISVNLFLFSINTYLTIDSIKHHQF